VTSEKSLTQMIMC